MAGGSKSVGKDETREFPKGRLEISTVGDTMVGRATFEPGWSWHECVQPIVGGDSCQVPHSGYVISGRLHIKMDDGTEFDVGAGDAYDIPPGHDGWVVGEETYVGVDFSKAMQDYAKK
ncbi:MAG: cupin domain-containing protein [Acidimicrobiia bacterium]|nr:cupin domain-containing protein [Acidimicrobiia bacterium]